MSRQHRPWPLLVAPAEVQATVALALPPGDRLSLSRAHPALREAASQQGWFEKETVKVEKDRSTLPELETLAAWARCNRAQLNVAVMNISAGQSLEALHGTRITAFSMWSSEPPLVRALGGFSELRSLSLAHCGLSTVPPTLSSLTALEHLVLGGNGQLGEEGGGLEPLAALTQLRKLNLCNCGLHAVPPALSGLTALKHLDLGYNKHLGQEDNSLERLTSLTRLRSLALSDCTLRAVPRALSGLAALEHLDLRSNGELGAGSTLERLAALMQLRSATLPFHLANNLPRLQAAMPAVKFTTRAY